MKRNLSILLKTTFWRYAALILLGLNLLPIAVISIFNHPSADDYAYGTLVHAAWRESHSIAAYLQAFGQQMVKSYTTWQGSFGAAFLSTCMPAVFGEKAYMISTWFLAGLFVASVFYFFRVLFGRILGRKDIGDITAALVSLICIECLPRAIDMFYWYNGAVNYITFFAVTLFVSGGLLQLGLAGKLHPAALVVTILLAFFGSGGNYVPALIHLMVIFFLVVGICIYRKRASWQAILSLAAAAGGFVLSVLSPGNTVRMAQETADTAESSLIGVVGLSVKEAYLFLQQWMTPFVWILLLFLLPFLWDLVQGRAENDFEKLLARIPSLVVAGFIFLVFAASFAPNIYVDGTTGPLRTADYRYFLMILLLVLTEVFVLWKIKLTLMAPGAGGDPVMDRAEFDARLKRLVLPILLSCSAMCILFTAYYVIPKESRLHLHSVCAARSLLIGEAAAFDREMTQREALLLSDETDLVIEPVHNQPELLYSATLDITEDPTYWINETLAAYYDKNSVRIAPQ